MASVDTKAGETGARSAAARAAEALAPEAGLLAALDPVAFGKAIADVGAGVTRHPGAATAAAARWGASLIAVFASGVARALGSGEPRVRTDPKDKRFTDPAWESNPYFFTLLHAYLSWCALLSELVDAAGIAERDSNKAKFALKMVADAVAPTNFLWTNPKAIKTAFDTGGASVLKGLRNFIADVATNGGLPRQVDASSFELGVNLAATPGKVVFRSELMELIQYVPQTEAVYETPLVCSPPWINKYYIMDLSPGRSFIEWAVRHGHTVFAISYRNPDESMSGLSLDDYLVKGPRTALDVVGEITGAPQVNMVGLCLGGTLTTMLLAYLADQGDDRVRSATLLNTLVDFSEPGPLAVFTDHTSVARLERRMERRGFLDAKDLARTFDLLRANDLIWNYVATNWLMGESPPPFDILAWNVDGTRMPANMHSLYLRSCYMRNELARGEMTLAGSRLRLDDITEDVYILAAVEDHIAPWRSSYATTRLLKSDVRFVLSSSGHIAGIVNPPSSKARHFTNDVLPADPQEWLAGTTRRDGSWWEDWTQWISVRSGDKVAPPPLGGNGHQPLGDAPGTYVRLP